MKPCIEQLVPCVALWFAFNSLLGLLVGLVGGARPVRWQGAWVWRVKVGSPLDWLFTHWFFPITAQTFGLIILLAPGADRPNVVAHELVHVRQQRWRGPLFFVLYFFYFLVQLVRLGNVAAAYQAIPYEVAARAVEEHR